MIQVQVRRLRVAATLFGFALALVAGALGILGTLSVQAADNDVKEAYIVVQFDESDAIIRPISFTGEISGLRALELSGLDFEVENFGWGSALCSLEGVGCPVGDCFCGGNTFWGTSFWNGSGWEGYPVGIADTVISQTGAIDGYRWGEFPETPSPAPDAMAAQDALEWLQEQQSEENGSYGDQVSPSVGVMLALGANHLDAAEWRRSTDAPSLLDYVSIAGIGYSHEGAAEAGRLAAGMAAAEGCWSPGAAAPSDYYVPDAGRDERPTGLPFVGDSGFSGNVRHGCAGQCGLSARVGASHRRVGVVADVGRGHELDGDCHAGADRGRCTRVGNGNRERVGVSEVRPAGRRRVPVHGGKRH